MRNSTNKEKHLIFNKPKSSRKFNLQKDVSFRNPIIRKKFRVYEVAFLKQ